MRKEVLVLVLLALALVVAGCQGGGDNRTSSSTPFIGGSEGLRVSFVENAPPNEVLDNQEPVNKDKIQKFDIILKLENAGEQDIAVNNAKVTIGGIFPADFGVPGLTTRTPVTLQNVLFQKKLDGVKKDPEGDKIPGGIEEMQFNELGYMKQLEGNTEFPIQADVCYKYTTKAVGDFCMRADLTRTQGGVCQAKGTKPVFSSGSPVQVTSVDESIGGRTKVILKFKIKTVGSGSFFKPEAIGATSQQGCERGNFAKENFVKVTVNSGVAGLACSGFSGTPPVGDVRLTNGEGSVTCIQDGVSVDAVQKVNLQIEYNHLITASTSLLVKHLPGFEGGGQTCTVEQTGGAACTTSTCYAGHMATSCNPDHTWGSPYCKADNPTGPTLCAGTSTPSCSNAVCTSSSAGACTTAGEIDSTCTTSSGSTGTRVCKTDKTWTACVSPGGTPT